jgi:hypothetical protein
MNVRSLFSRATMSDLIESYKRDLAKEVQAMASDYILRTPEEGLFRYLVDKWTLALPVLGQAEIQGTEDVEIDVSWQRDRYFRAGTRPVVPGTRFTLAVTYEGDPDLFDFGVYMGPSIAGNVLRDRNELHLYAQFDNQSLTKEAADAALKGQLEAVTQMLARVKPEVDQYQAALPTLVTEHLGRARARAEKSHSVSASLSFPLRRKDAPSQPVPVTRKPLAVTRPQPSSAPPSSILQLQAYNEILDMLSNMSEAMERSPEAYEGLSEEFLRDHFLMTLNANFGGGATGETFNVSGKTDILIRVEGRVVFVAECKFWKGGEGLRQTIDQLIAYLSWRDTKVAVLLFNRRKDFAAVLSKIPGSVAEHKDHIATVPGYNYPNRFRYRFKHNDAAGGEMLLTVMAFNVPSENGPEPKQPVVKWQKPKRAQ